jgi:hypothetical protein
MQLRSTILVVSGMPLSRLITRAANFQKVAALDLGHRRHGCAAAEMPCYRFSIMTEEIIDKLSKIPGLRVPAPGSSFYLKGKKMPIADVAKSLGVTYVLDGSVRKSGAMLRVGARLGARITGTSSGLKPTTGRSTTCCRPGTRSQMK